jgi:hypothetical protein
LKQVVVLADAAEDLEAARDFYDMQEPGVGEYCVDSLLADIEAFVQDAVRPPSLLTRSQRRRFTTARF